MTVMKICSLQSVSMKSINKMSVFRRSRPEVFLRTPFPRNTSGWLLLDILLFRLSSCNKGKCFQKGWMFLLEKTDASVWCLFVHFFCWISNHFLRVSSVLMLWLYLNAGYLSSENVNVWGFFLLLLFFFV